MKQKMTLLKKPLTHQRFFCLNTNYISKQDCCSEQACRPERSEGSVSSRIDPSLRSGRHEGFTLLEVMIAIGLVAGVITLFVSSVGNNNNQIKESVREISVLSREIYYKAKLNQATYRLVIDMKEGPDSELTHTYWVEKGDKNFLASADSLSEAFKQDTKKEKDEDKAPPNGGFTIDTRTMKKPKALASGIFFSGVEIVGHDKAFDSGKVFIHYLPQGFVDEAAIHLKYSDELQWTMAIHPLTGKADIFPEDISLKEIRDQ